MNIRLGPLFLSRRVDNGLQLRRASLAKGIEYFPPPVRRVEVPKADGSIAVENNGGARPAIGQGPSSQTTCWAMDSCTNSTHAISSAVLAPSTLSTPLCPSSPTRRTGGPARGLGTIRGDTTTINRLDRLRA